MPGSLFDTSVWIAAVFPLHPLHMQAQQALRAATAEDPAVFCRSTQQSFLRLASTPVGLRTYGAEELTNRDALTALEVLLALPQVSERDELPGAIERWRSLAGVDTASPKVWMDAYQAAFALSCGMRLTTLDRDFLVYAVHGLEVRLLGL